MSESATYDYARVSSRDQNLSRQLDAFSKLGIARERVFCDKASGKDFERPQYKRLIRRLPASSGCRRRPSTSG